MHTREQLNAVENGSIDLAFVRSASLIRHPGIVARIWHTDPLWVVVPNGHRWARRRSLHIEECRDETFIGFPAEAGTGMRAAMEQLCAAQGFRPRFVQEATDAMTQIGLVAAGLGIAVLPSPWETLGFSGLRHIRLVDADAKLHVCLTTRQDDSRPKGRISPKTRSP